MAGKKTLFLRLTAVLFVVLLVFGGWALYMALPTYGKHIIEYADPQKALLIVDMQEDCTGTAATPPYPYPDSEKLIVQANKVLDAAHKDKDMTVIFIKQEFSGPLGRMWSKAFLGGRLMKGDPRTEIDKRLPFSDAHVFSKPKGDAFSNPELGDYLVQQRVNEVFIAGVDGEFCVRLTAKGALNKGYKVNIINDCVGVMNEKKRDELIAKYGDEGIKVLTADEFILWVSDQKPSPQ
jgi:nicotinamidase-related amidase